MKGRQFKSIFAALALLLLAASFTSCNRGYGCPNNFSVNKIATEVVKGVAAVVK